MTVTLPTESQRWPMFRLLTRDSWGAGTTDGASGGGWQVQRLQTPSPTSSGFILLSYSRCLLPQTGSARLLFRFGKFGSRFVGASAATNTALQHGAPWDPESDTLELPDLTGKEIRIQCAPRGTDDSAEAISSANWVTVFWGTCEYQTDSGFGGGAIPSGDREYTCVDALYRLKRWPLDRHGWYSNGTATANAKGHPGYNVSLGDSSQILGNRESTGVTFTTVSGASAFSHTHAGAGTTWTDAQAINHALAVSRPPGEPLWTLSGATDLFAGTTAWEVTDGDTAWDLLTRICNRGRGKGAVALGWTESDATGPLTPVLKSYAQLLDDLSFQLPAAGSVVTVNGASTNGTAVTVDLIGDHRVVDGSVIVGDPEQYRVDYLETMGECIQSLVTLSYEDATLERGWSAAEQTSFLALDPENRADMRWYPVFQLHRMARSFNFSTKNGAGGGNGRCDFQCLDNGSIGFVTPVNTSMGNTEVMDDLPLYEGYTYTSTPVRADGQSVSAYAGQPGRRPLMVFVRNSANNFKFVQELGASADPKLLPDGFAIDFNNDQAAGTRFIGLTTEGDLGSFYDYTQLVFTVALKLPHRVRLGTGDPNGRRKLQIILPNLHLWMAHQGAIWDLDTSTRTSSGDFSTAKRAAAASTTGYAGILRDDRDTLARVHYLAVSWYGPLEELLTGENQAIHSGAQWALKCCGDIPSSTLYDGGGVVYPDVGKVVQWLYTNGQKIPVRTPVSSFTYDNESGVTTWVTDWQDLDFRSV